ncbi:MAG: hypothetical protein Q9166_002639 [cf. Caloplaca sp. 2 TL-2023]
MSLSYSYTEASALAGQAHAKFAGQFDAKDQNLRLIIAHAQLYDRLDDHIKRLRKKPRLNSSKETFHTNLLAVPNSQDPFEIKQQAHTSEDRMTSKDISGSQTALDLAVECAVEDDEEIDVSLGSSSRAIIHDVGDTEDGDKSRRAHGMPFVVGASRPSETYDSVYSTYSNSQTIVSEIPIEDSDSDSDSDSYSDYEDNLDYNISFYTQQLKATELSTPRPNSIQPDIKCDEHLSDALQASDFIPHVLSEKDNLPNLEQFASSLLAPEKGLSVTDNEAPTSALALSKTSPLLPQLCNDGTDVSSAIHQAYELQQALRRHLNPSPVKPRRKSSIEYALSCIFPSLAFSSRKKDSKEADGQIDDEEVIR